ncbi:MAG TPA: hypothetical protein VMZ71_03935, partial [Gemmataceae bacterium]|nr:hypothetical protein [Gemmataceae bacterium]
GDFLTYGAGGFARATYTQASAVPINSSTATTVYEANVAQTLTSGSTAAAYALKVGAVTISGAGGTTTLQVGPQTAGTQAGLILNGGTIATSALAFGAAEALVYAGPAGGTIAAATQGSGSLVKFGSGALTVTAASQYTGAVFVQQGALIAANPSGSATGTGAVTVGPAGTFQVNAGTSTGSAAGTAAQSGGTVRMNGGTLTGPLVMNDGSTLTGSGTITGTATLSGAITGLTSLTFTGPVTSTATMTYSWRLNALDDSAAGAGTSYSQLRFNGSPTVLGNGGSSTGFYLNFDLAEGLPDPNSSDPFWGAAHSWAVMRASPFFQTIWYRGAGFPEFSRGDFSISFDAGFTAMSVVYTPVPVPEPGALVAVACAALAAGRTLRRRRAPESRTETPLRA